VKVLPFDLLKPYYTASIDYHGSLAAEGKGTISSHAKSKVQVKAELENMVVHGLSNCQHYFGFSEKQLREMLELRSQAGMDNTVLYMKGHRMWLLSKTQEELEKIKTQVRTIIEIAKEYGYEEVYFYGRDEATGEALKAQRKSWEAVREAGGKIFVAGERDNLAYMADIQDMHVKSGWPCREEVRGWHEQGGKIFSYCNPQIGVENPETYRRNFGLVMWKYNYDGIANNAYQHTFGLTWNDFDHPRYRSHSFTYPTVDGVIDTIAWEGWREGIDDVRYITTLEKTIEQAEQAGNEKPTDILTAARSFVKKLKNSTTIETADLDELRREIVKHILKLQDTNDKN
jgi:hypothetical protein